MSERPVYRPPAHLWALLAALSLPVWAGIAWAVWNAAKFFGPS